MENDGVNGQSLPDLGLVLTGGGARGAYQIGVLRWIARHYPDIHVPILTGVSAGAVNVTRLAASAGRFDESVNELHDLWSGLEPQRIFRVDTPSIARQALRWGMRLMSGGAGDPSDVRAFLDTAPLRHLLHETLAPADSRIPGIDANLQSRKLRAVAITATSYSTGQTVTFVQGRDFTPWIRPQRRAVSAHLTVDHVMASAALPIFFPAVRIGDQWYGDGGIRLAAPLSPALHLGAHRVLAVSTRYDRTVAESDVPLIAGYPPPAQVLGMMLNAVFLDLLDQDTLRLERLNQLLLELPPEKRLGLRLIKLLVIRPSVDLGRLAGEYESELPRAFRFMIRGLGTRQTRSPDLLSMLLFQPDYIARLVAIGEADAERRAPELTTFLGSEQITSGGGARGREPPAGRGEGLGVQT
jgi:NTE family protein